MARTKLFATRHAYGGAVVSRRMKDEALVYNKKAVDECQLEGAKVST